VAGEKIVKAGAGNCPYQIDYGLKRNYGFPMKFRVIVEPDEDGVFVAECPSLPGCISQGATRSEALDNIKDAISGYLASLNKHDEPVPLPISEEVVEVPA
jgi:antitoxin HicB